MSQEHQEPQGQPPAPFEPFTGKLTKTQAGILRTLWDLETGQGQLSSLRHGLHSSAAKLVGHGLIWKKDRWPARPVYGITPAGIPAALEAWREVYPERAQAEIEARCQPQLPPGVRPIIEEALATGDLAKANAELHQLSGGKTIQQVAADWAGQIQPPADPPQREQQQPRQPDPQLPPDEPRPSPSDGGHGYTQRVYQAYRDLAKQYRSPDVRIDALHGRLGGSLQDLHRWLRQACRDHLAVPSTGEPALADHAARQSALWLPGETDRATGKPQSFLLIKLIDPPTMTQAHEQQPQQPIDDDPFGAEGLTAEQKLLNVAKGVLRYTEVKYKQTLGRSDTYAGSLDQIALAARHLAEDITAYLQQRQQSPEQQYEYHLRQSAALRYPPEGRTAELEARIEKTIQRKVGDFLQEQQHRERVRLYENSLRRQLAEKHPNLTPEQAQRYERRINELVDNFRKNQAQQQQPQAQPPAARSQEQGRGMEVER